MRSVRRTVASRAWSSNFWSASHRDRPRKSRPIILPSCLAKLRRSSHARHRDGRTAGQPHAVMVDCHASPDLHPAHGPAEEGGYDVYVPALPSCVTQGDTFEEAVTMAQEAMGASTRRWRWRACGCRSSRDG